MTPVVAWLIEEGTELQDGRCVLSVNRNAVRRVVTLTLEGPAGLEWETWLAEAPLIVKDDPLPKRAPGAALLDLVRRWGPLGGGAG